MDFLDELLASLGASVSGGRGVSSERDRARVMDFLGERKAAIDKGYEEFGVLGAGGRLLEDLGGMWVFGAPGAMLANGVGGARDEVVEKFFGPNVGPKLVGEINQLLGNEPVPKPHGPNLPTDADLDPRELLNFLASAGEVPAFADKELADRPKAPMTSEESADLSKMLDAVSKGKFDDVITLNGNRVSSSSDKKMGFSRSNKSIGETIKEDDAREAVIQKLKALELQKEIEVNADNSAQQLLDNTIKEVAKDLENPSNIAILSELLALRGVNIDLKRIQAILKGE